MKNRVLLSLALGAVALGAQAQVTLFADNFDNASRAGEWTVASTGDAGINYSFDYSTVGITSSSGTGGTTLGLRMTANDVDAAGTDPTEAVLAIPTAIGANPNNDFTLRFKMWINHAGTTATTEFAYFGTNIDNTSVFRPTGGVTGTNPATAVAGVSPTNSGYAFGVTGDGGAARDYRAFLNGTEDVTDSGTTAKHILDANGNFVSVAQDSLHPYYPTVFTGTGPGQTAGEAGNQWVSVEVTNVGGAMSYTLNGFSIYTTTNSLTTGKPFLGYGDPFASVSPAAANTFVVFDDFEYLNPVPEPATMAVLGLGALAALRRRRK